MHGIRINLAHYPRAVMFTIIINCPIIINNYVPIGEASNIQLLIIADDFTGALDTGVQFAKAGVSTSVLLECGMDMARPASGCEVLVVNADSRHLAAGQARLRVADIAARGVGLGCKYLYKKTDSCLRGNIGAELEGAMDAVGNRPMYFAPAFPKAGRTTNGGVQYVNGVPVSETAFGKDPFEPVRHSSVARIIACQTDLPVRALPCGVRPEADDKRAIFVLDAKTDLDLRDAAKWVCASGARLLAGCAGFAEFLPDALALKRAPRPTFMGERGVLIISGSVNPVTAAQLKHAAERGFDCVTLLPEQKLTPGYADTPECARFIAQLARRYAQSGRLIVQAVDYDPSGLPLCPGEGEQARRTVAHNIGGMARRLLLSDLPGAYVFIGGDTLRAALRDAQYESIEPIDEIAPGVVFAKISGRRGEKYIVTKSGGLGEENVVETIEAYLLNRIPNSSPQAAR